MAEVIAKATDVEVIYGDKPALDKINMSVKKGDIYALIGKNGAGKFSCGRWDGAVSAAAVVAVFCREGGRSPAGQSFFRGLEK